MKYTENIVHQVGLIYKILATCFESVILQLIW